MRREPELEEQAPKRHLDLNDLVKQQELLVTLGPAEDPADRQARINREAATLALEHMKDKIVFFMGIGIVTIAFVLSAWAAYFSGDPGKLTLGEKGLFSIVTGLLGYMVGRKGQ